MRSCNLLVFILAVFILPLRAQPAEETILPGTSYLPEQVAKLGPFHVLNFYPTLQFAFEQKITPEFTLQLSAGYVLTFMSNYDPEFQNKRGVKLKLEPRYYLPGTIRPRSAFYFSLQPYVVMINFDRETSQIECFDLDCTIQFRRWYNFEVKYREQGVAFQYGVHLYNRRITLDVSLGTVLRNVEYKKPPLTRGLDPDFVGWIMIPNEDTRTTFGPTGAFWLGYKFHHVRK